MKKLMVLAFAGLCPLIAYSADEPASTPDWAKCAKEMQEFSCKGTDKEIWQCLEEHDPQLSEECDRQHEKGDSLFEDE